MAGRYPRGGHTCPWWVTAASLRRRLCSWNLLGPRKDCDREEKAMPAAWPVSFRWPGHPPGTGRGGVGYRVDGLPDCVPWDRLQLLAGTVLGTVDRARLPCHGPSPSFGRPGSASISWDLALDHAPSPVAKMSLEAPAVKKASEHPASLFSIPSIDLSCENGRT
jgi:hypothetical protein